MLPRITIAAKDDAQTLASVLLARHTELYEFGERLRKECDDEKLGPDSPKHAQCLQAFKEMEHIGELLTAVTREYISLI